MLVKTVTSLLCATLALSGCAHSEASGSYPEFMVKTNPPELQGKVLEYRRWRKFQNVSPLGSACWDNAWCLPLVFFIVPIDLVFGWRIVTYDGYFEVKPVVGKN